MRGRAFIGILGFMSILGGGRSLASTKDDLCGVLNSGRNRLATLAQQFSNESNPLKKSNVQQEYGAAIRQFNSDVVGFLQANSQIQNYTGVVSFMEVKGYNTGPGVMLGIDLGCNASVAVQFVEITNPGWGGLDPTMQTPLTPWRPVLENLAVHDAVTFSGHFFLRYGPTQINLEGPGATLGLEAVLTDLIKGTVDARSAPELSADEALRITRASRTVSESVTIRVRRTAVFSSDRNWESWRHFIGAADLLKSTLQKRGWQLSGFVVPGVGYYDIHGNIDPPEAAKKWIVGGTVEEYIATFLEHADFKIVNFSAHENTAVGTFIAKHSGCTEFCEVWKEVRPMPDYIGRNIFGADYNPSYDINAGETISVDFSWDPTRGWHALEGHVTAGVPNDRAQYERDLLEAQAESQRYADAYQRQQEQAAAPAAPKPAVNPSESGHLRPEQLSAARTHDYWAAWSSPNTVALGTIENFYADTIKFYGKAQSRRQVMKEKRKFADRWPDRTYAPRDGSVVIQCAQATCDVRGVVDWKAASAARSANASGAANFSFTFVTSGDIVKIASESGSVIK